MGLCTTSWCIVLAILSKDVEFVQGLLLDHLALLQALLHLEGNDSLSCSPTSLSGGLVCPIRLYLLPSNSDTTLPGQGLPKRLPHAGLAARGQVGSKRSASPFCLSGCFSCW